MTSAAYKLFRQIAGIGYYAEVRVTVTPAPTSELRVSPEVFAWSQHDPGPASPTGYYQDGARAGVTYALANLANAHGAVRVDIEEIHYLEVDSTPGTVAVAACHATWLALEDPGRKHPQLGPRIVFPGGGMDEFETRAPIRRAVHRRAWFWVLVAIVVSALVLALATSQGAA